MDDSDGPRLTAAERREAAEAVQFQVLLIVGTVVIGFLVVWFILARRDPRMHYQEMSEKQKRRQRNREMRKGREAFSGEGVGYSDKGGGADGGQGGDG
mmetsp:Transcript_24950/g.58931  ORF Transcript_24950/g.58931 Transcript_24950/m.58931 type:complete len:98 (+) Transcript_24950:20-313(+)